MTPEGLFSLAGTLALSGWAALAAGILLKRRRLRDVVAGIVVPAVLSAGYTAIVLAHWAGTEGGFGSLAEVAALFASPWLLLAGWVHYLAFDLFVGAWIARDAERRGIGRIWPLATLPAVLLFGPAGFLLWLGIRTVHPAGAVSASAPMGRVAP